jgi:hypothetical protein
VCIRRGNGGEPEEMERALAPCAAQDLAIQEADGDKLDHGPRAEVIVGAGLDVTHSRSN